MSRIILKSAILLTTTIGLACNASPPDNTLDSLPLMTDLHAGYAVYGHEVRSFRPCGSEEALWTTDATNALWAAYETLAPAEHAYEEIFTIVQGRIGAAPASGFGAEYPGQLSVRDVLYVANEGYDCALDLSAFWARGSGNEPFWSFTISQRGIDFSTLGGASSHWNDARVEVDSSRVTIYSIVPPAITIELETHPCTDSMSGAIYARSARVALQERSFEGCALRGAGAGPRLSNQ